MHVSHNATGNIALSGISLYVILGSINIGLMGRSRHQLSQILNDDLHELHNTKAWLFSHTSTKWNSFRQIAQYRSNMKSELFYRCVLYSHYEIVSYTIFNTDHIEIDISNPATSVRKINELVSRNMPEGFIRNIIDESSRNENKIFLVYNVHFQTEWTTNFDPELTKQEIFYNDKGQPLDVAMMNQKSYYDIYDLPNHKFRILFKSLTDRGLYGVIILPRELHRVDDVLKNIKVFLKVSSV
ncbi:Leukocyte elastase inhibitor [Thelohanellus kitauei]|uniref:Leukocyte elastase inhibitor n=1 Tax=Thelohanellus kitauei TaxID=669202 RepID=A0A0C2J0C0_THEKT|nr:Leukocyte elastase inhibitor [Thelohanellus kitauei]